MSEKLDPVIEAALIQAAASMAVEAHAVSERNQRALSNISGPHGLPVIEQEADRNGAITSMGALFTEALHEVTRRYTKNRHI